MWLNHTLIGIRYTLSDVQAGQRPPWRFNESLLQDPDILADIVKEIGHYFDTNNTHDSDIGVAWEAHKVVFRGVLIKTPVQTETGTGSATGIAPHQITDPRNIS